MNDELFYSFFKSLVGKDVVVELKNDLRTVLSEDLWYDMSSFPEMSATHSFFKMQQEKRLHKISRDDKTMDVMSLGEAALTDTIVEDDVEVEFQLLGLGSTRKKNKLKTDGQQHPLALQRA
ncbi:LSM2-like protein [Mya arenaria]|uniref:LSM2-like protein n=1 Tax=Mya arenaria TaxID=6604 RepID=A0ABY7GAW0_MYAAR|nr:LSM2-like protein [Mya arenaria]